MSDIIGLKNVGNKLSEAFGSLYDVLLEKGWGNDPYTNFYGDQVNLFRRNNRNYYYTYSIMKIPGNEAGLTADIIINCSEQNEDDLLITTVGYKWGRRMCAVTCRRILLSGEVSKICELAQEDWYDQAAGFVGCPKLEGYDWCQSYDANTSADIEHDTDYDDKKSLLAQDLFRRFWVNLDSGEPFWFLSPRSMAQGSSYVASLKGIYASITAERKGAGYPSSVATFLPSRDMLIVARGPIPGKILFSIIN